MKDKEFEKVIEQVSDTMDKGMLGQLALLTEENDYLKEIIKVMQKRLDNYQEMFLDIAGFATDKDTKSNN